MVENYEKQPSESSGMHWSLALSLSVSFFLLLHKVYRFALGVIFCVHFPLLNANTRNNNKTAPSSQLRVPTNNNKPVSAESVINFGMLSNILSIN